MKLGLDWWVLSINGCVPNEGYTELKGRIFAEDISGAATFAVNILMALGIEVECVNYESQHVAELCIAAKNIVGDVTITLTLEGM